MCSEKNVPRHSIKVPRIILKRLSGTDLTNITGSSSLQLNNEKSSTSIQCKVRLQSENPRRDGVYHRNISGQAEGSRNSTASKEKNKEMIVSCPIPAGKRRKPDNISIETKSKEKVVSITRNIAKGLLAKQRQSLLDSSLEACAVNGVTRKLRNRNKELNVQSGNTKSDDIITNYICSSKASIGNQDDDKDIENDDAKRTKSSQNKLNEVKVNFSGLADLEQERSSSNKNIQKFKINGVKKRKSYQNKLSELQTNDSKIVDLEHERSSSNENIQNVIINDTKKAKPRQNKLNKRQTHNSRLTDLEKQRSSSNENIQKVIINCAKRSNSYQNKLNKLKTNNSGLADSEQERPSSNENIQEVIINEEDEENEAQDFKLIHVPSFEKHFRSQNNVGLEENNKNETLSKDYDHLESDIEIIKEIENTWFTIGRSEPYQIEKNNKILYKRSEKSDIHIANNKYATISIPPSKNTCRLLGRKVIFDEDINTDEKTCKFKKLVEKAIQNKDFIKVKPPESLGMINQDNRNPARSNCRDTLLKYDQLRTQESKISQICVLYGKYFDENLKSEIRSLFAVLHSALTELLDNEGEKFSELSSLGNLELEKDSCLSIIKKHSKAFVEIFQKTLNLIEKPYRRSLIPIIYSRLLTENKHLSLVKSEMVINIILLIYRIENFYNEDDLIFYKTFDKSMDVLSIYDRWIGALENEDKTMCTENKLENTSTGDDFKCFTVDENKEEVKEDIFAPLNKDLEETEPKTQLYNELLNCTVVESFETQDKKNIVVDFEDKKMTIFEHQEFFLPCPNSSCQKTLTIPCFYCKEPVSCADLCQVDKDQWIGSKMREDGIFTFISCEYHKSIKWEERFIEEWNKSEEVYIPEELKCWRVGCSKKVYIICVCKARAYCSEECRHDDWFSSHHETCNLQPDPTLLYKS